MQASLLPASLEDSIPRKRFLGFNRMEHEEGILSSVLVAIRFRPLHARADTELCGLGTGARHNVELPRRVVLACQCCIGTDGTK